MIGVLGFIGDRLVALLGVGFDWLLVGAGVVVVLASYGLALAWPWLAVVMRFLGPVARLAGFALILVGSLRLYAQFEVDRALAAAQARQEAAVRDALDKERVRGDAAVTAAVAAAEARAVASMPIRERVIREAVPSSCPTPGNLLSAGVELLRRHPGDRGGAASAAGGAAAPLSPAVPLAGPRKP